MDWGVAQLVECWPRIHQALGFTIALHKQGMVRHSPRNANTREVEADQKFKLILGYTVSSRPL